MRRPRVSIVLATFNRGEVVQETLEKLQGLELHRSDYEIIVVENGSKHHHFDSALQRADRVIRLSGNKGSCAKAWGVDVAQGRYIVFLDDDSYPCPGSIARMIDHFERDARLGAAGFTIHLPNGERESSALPGVFVGCGVGFNTEALREVGGLDRTFFMQAEEYDLAFKLVTAGWDVRVFDDLHVEHLKTPAARRSERTIYYDIRNNLRVIARHLRARAAKIYREDWTQRYRWLAEREGHAAMFEKGRRAGVIRGWWDRIRFARKPLSEEGFEHFFRWNEVAAHFARLRASGVRRVALLDWGKNIYAFFRGAREAGIEIPVIGDDRFAAPGRSYRGVPIAATSEALALNVEALVVSNMAATQAGEMVRRVRALTQCPVHGWYADGTVSPTHVGSEPESGRRYFGDPDESIAVERLVVR